MEHPTTVSLQDHFDTQLASMRRELDARARAQDEALKLVAENLKSHATQQAAAYRTLVAVMGLFLAALEIISTWLRH